MHAHYRLHRNLLSALNIPFDEIILDENLDTSVCRLRLNQPTKFHAIIIPFTAIENPKILKFCLQSQHIFVIKMDDRREAEIPKVNVDSFMEKLSHIHIFGAEMQQVGDIYDIYLNTYKTNHSSISQKHMDIIESHMKTMKQYCVSRQQQKSHGFSARSREVVCTFI